MAVRLLSISTALSTIVSHSIDPFRASNRVSEISFNSSSNPLGSALDELESHYKPASVKGATPSLLSSGPKD